MEMIILKRGSSDWDYIWDYLKSHPINEGIEEPHVAFNNGEVWQYMGSYKNGSNVISEFRHRQHPKTNDVYRISLEHSVEDINIELSKKIK